MNNLLDKKNEQVVPYFCCILSKNFGVLTINVAVRRSASSGLGPGSFESLCQDFLKIGSGIGAYSPGRGAP